MKLEKNGFVNDLLRWFEAYKGHLKSIGYSKSTISLYCATIDHFIEYSRQFQDEMSMSEINTLFIASFLSYMGDRANKVSKNKLKKDSISNSTKKFYLKALKSFLIFISDNNDDLFTYERIFEKIKIKERRFVEKVDYLNEEEIERLLLVLENEINEYGRYDNYRNSLLVKLMLFAGLRVSEALHIKLEDLDRFSENAYKIRVFGKGGYEQFAFINAEVIEDELFYFQNRLSRNSFIMKTSKGKLLSRQNAFSIAKRLYKKAGISKQGLHILRHTFAMRLAKSGVDVLVIQKALRHASISSTMVYAKAEESQVAAAIAQTAS